MDMVQWTLLDFIFLLILLVSTVLAVVKGLAREVISLVAVVGGLILAGFFYDVPGAWFERFTSTEALASLLGFFSIFIGCLILGALIAFVVNKFLKIVSLRWADRVLGGVFGFVRGWLIASILALALIAFPVSPDSIAQSNLAPFLLAGSRTVVLLVPSELKERFYSQYQRVVHAWNQNRRSV